MRSRQFVNAKAFSNRLIRAPEMPSAFHRTFNETLGELLSPSVIQIVRRSKSTAETSLNSNRVS